MWFKSLHAPCTTENLGIILIITYSDKKKYFKENMYDKPCKSHRIINTFEHFDSVEFVLT